MPELSHLIIISSLSLISTILLFICTYKMLQIYQLSSYRTKEVVAWLKKTKLEYILRYFSLSFFIFVPTALFIACFGKYEYVQYIGFLFFVLLCAAFFAITMRQVKVAVKFTARLIRLSVLLVIVYALLSFALLLLTSYNYFQYSYISILPLAIPFITMLCNTLLLPIESLICRSYKTKASKKLKNASSLIKIAITGSYGKTTAKNILESFLSKKYRVCATPKSYNTPMGITKVINGQLKDTDEVFIAEMGARYVGDIKELCSLVKPQIGLLTAIGDMHLETFGSKENIIKTKCELIDCLPPDGLAVVCGDNEILSNLFDGFKTHKLISCDSRSEIQCSYSNVNFDESGTSFDLSLDGSTERVRTKLLGNHIPKLIALCALAAHSLGVTLEQIAEACGQIEAIPHRLELIKKNNLTIIDDAYNSNPEGAKNAVTLLSQFEGTRIVITPGMIELGDISRQAHNEFGMQIASNSDYAILIGRNAAAINEGINRSQLMSAENVYIVNTLEEAMAKLSGINAEKKVVLFENDLPDNY